ncbi:insulinase family protein [Lutibacter sp. B2]|nr:insulinase family protein [Lutibacter sp. B2]
MLKKYKTVEIDKNINLHVIKTDKFKTNMINVYIKRPLSKDEVTKNALLSMVLSRGSKNFPTTMELSKELEGLYGAGFVCDAVKKGEKNIIRFAIQLVNDRYVDEENVMKKGLYIINDFINNPYILNHQFDENYVVQEKKNLIERIEGRKNDKMSFAYGRCIEEMCQGEPYALYEYGNIDDVNAITSKALYEHYKNVMSTSSVDISVVGDIDERLIEGLIKENLKFNMDHIVDIKREQIQDADKVTIIKEVMDINQGKLTLGYRTNIPYEDKLYNALIVCSNILGGGANSKLFKNVREKESLCYYVFSRLQKFKSLMMIAAGVEFENYDKAVSLIGKEVEDMKKGNFSEEDLMGAQNSIITSIRSMSDSAGTLSDFYYTQSICKNEDSLEKIIEKIRKVTKEEIVQVAQNIKLDTIYFLNNEEEGRTYEK